jgi:hypothetical protein
MGTTTNNGWPTPVATDLVKDGWEAIKDLGDAIDTTLGVYAPSTPGLTLINTTSFSGVASQSVNDVFSATYENYRILVTGVSSAGGNLQARLRVGGADNSTASSYVHQSLTGNSTTVAAARGTANFWNFGNINTTLVNGFSIDLYNPFLASATGYNCYDLRSDSGAFIQLTNGTHNQTVSYTGFTLIAETGNITGNVSVYGYNK